MLRLFLFSCLYFLAFAQSSACKADYSQCLTCTDCIDAFEYNRWCHQGSRCHGQWDWIVNFGGCMGSCGTITSINSVNCGIDQIRASACRLWQSIVTGVCVLLFLLLAGSIAYCVLKRRYCSGYEAIEDTKL